MASIKLYLDTRTERKDGTHSIKLSVSHKKTFLISLNVSIKKVQWNGTAVIDHANKKQINTYLEQRLTRAKNLIFDLSVIGKLNSMEDKELKKCIESDSSTEVAEEEIRPYLFIDGYNTYVNRLTKDATKSSLRDTYSKISKYTDIQILTFEGMNLSWLKDFDSFMQADGLAPNSRGIYLRNMRAIFNDAIDRDNIPQNFYPFRRFKMPKAKTKKRSLPAEKLIKIRDCKCEPHQEKYRDLFMLIFYLIGINIVDLLNLKEIENGRINFSRSKTGRLYSIKVEPEALEIINKYKGENYLLCFMDSYTNYRDFRHRLNNNLKEVAKKAFENSSTGLTTYYARHSWATCASDLDISKETIAAALGHGGNTVTDIYIDFDQKKIDEANRKVIDYVLNYQTARDKNEE